MTSKLEDNGAMLGKRKRSSQLKQAESSNPTNRNLFGV